MKKILILGASFLQVPIIKQAKKLGYYTLVVDQNPQSIGFKYADEYELISTLDYKRLKEYVAFKNPDGVVTAATDMPMRVIAKLGEEFNLNTIPYTVACYATDKALMRRKLEEKNIPIPKFYIVENQTEFLNAIKHFSKDKIIKPADSSGSRGVYLLNEESDPLTIYKRAREYSTNKLVLVEEYMQGKEVSVESFTIDGKTTVFAITDKITTGAPYFTEMGHSIQSSISDEIAESIRELTIKTIESLGITSGPTHTEIMITNDGPKIVEIGARLGGDMISSHLVKYATGVNLLELHLRHSVEDPIPNFTDILDYGSAIKYFQSKSGILEEISIPEEVYKNKNIVELQVNKSIGSKVSEINNSSERIGFVICKGENANKAILECEKVLEQIKIKIR